ncbi:MAG: DnaD domain protein [Clostridia bacterium]|nr:DnaD domain protein [Clostridia bacterium]
MEPLYAMSIQITSTEPEIFCGKVGFSVEKSGAAWYNRNMTVRFSPEAARREMTPVDNLFFTVYMPEADGMFVKVYLYGLMQCYHISLADDSIAEMLGISESEVRCAFVYWQAKGLVRIVAEEPLTVEYLLSEQPALTTATAVKYRPFVDALNALLAPRQLDLREMKAMYDVVELYGIEEAAALELVAYCIEQKGKRVSANYILAVAQTWNEQGIVTPAQAKESLESYRAKKHGATEVLLRWNKRRKPTQDEMDLYDKWRNEWGFDEEAILAVCPQLVEVGTPTFAILNDRLEQMRERNLSTATEIEQQSQQELDDREFCKLVFRRLGKVELPSRTDVAQMTMFRVDKGISPEAILLAADDCRSAERPLGVLKKRLIDWSAQGIVSVEDAKRALETAPKPQISGRKKKDYGFGNYQQNPVRMEDLKDIIVDLNEDL